MSAVESFTINLERSSGTYFSGEVVRGTVRLVTSAEIKTRGVRVRYQGLGYTRFHSGAGNYRNDFYGTKIYEEQRYTMYGNYFSTLVLEQAGTEAIFGAANGDGTMYIPCNEGEDVNIIVRVMGHSSIRAHDILGEVLLNTSMLVASGEPVSFPLQRNGGTTAGKVTFSATIVPISATFSISTSAASPYAGMERLQGRTFNAICQLRTHKASGLYQSAFISKNDVYVQAYRLSGSVDVTKALPEPDLIAVLPAGVLEFPFAFTVSADSPGSVELPVGDVSYIRYMLYANIDIPLWTDPYVHQVITVLPSVPLPTPKLLRGIEYKCDVPMKMASSALFSYFTGVGDITLDAKLMRQAYAPGENLEFSMRLVNNTSVVLSVECSLLCSVELQATQGVTMARKGEVSYKLFTGKVDPQDVYELSSDSTAATMDHTNSTPTTTNPTSTATATHSTRTTRNGNRNTTAVALVLPIPPVFPSFYGARGICKVQKEPMVFGYSVVFKVSVAGYFGSSRSVSLSVLICARPPSASALRTLRQSGSEYEIQRTPECDPFAMAYHREGVAMGDVADDSTLRSALVLPVGSVLATKFPKQELTLTANVQYYQPHTLCFLASNTSGNA